MSIRRLFAGLLAPGCAALTLLAGLMMPGSGALATSTTVKGVLIDQQCSSRAEARPVPGAGTEFEGGLLWAYTHDRKCLLMPDCQRSGYGVFTYDTAKFLPFDAAGNQKALAAIQTAKKLDDMRVEVTGDVVDGKIKVASLKLLP